MIGYASIRCLNRSITMAKEAYHPGVEGDHCNIRDIFTARCTSNSGSPL